MHNRCANRADPKRKRDAQIELEKSRKISYHRFPRELHKCQMWLAASNLAKLNISKTTTICSKHFVDDDFHNWCSSRRTLKNTAVPSIFPYEKRSTLPVSFIALPKSSVALTSPKSSISADVPKVDASTFITPNRFSNSSKVQQIREAHKRELKIIRRQLYNSRQQQVRYKKRIETLDTIIHSLKQKNLLSLEDLAIIENFSEFNKNLLH